MFKKILIANRGEIACRIIKTARKMGIKTVAVYADADKSALHVKMADESIYIGESPASKSYLVIDKILEAIENTQADAVHPGYGFLSENAAFAKTLKDKNIAFIGPNVTAIEVMGDKIESKKFADNAKVNTVPGHIGVIEDIDEAIKIAENIGYPVMIKASAGGGGKGMRIAYTSDEVSTGYELAKSEAKSSFGDDRIFIEKFIVEPRHIEIQVLGDKHGNVIHLNERECSIQRRNQKVVEEAPSSFLTPKTREEMGAQAVALAKAVDYDSAGTVEFIVDKNQNFYFLEMNTRLQVEHPVTELITGVDLVEQMILSASGAPLGLQQEDITINGWAIESRVYAEDPFRNFLPSIGRLTKYIPPKQSINDGNKIIRIDTGVVEGSEITMFYDPMISKLCTHAPTREAATDLMAEALGRYIVKGIGHNIPFLSAIMEHERWKTGDITTQFIEDEYPDGFQGAQLSNQDIIYLAICAVHMDHVENQRKRKISGQMNSHAIPFETARVATVNNQEISFNLMSEGNDYQTITLENENKHHHTITSNWYPGAAIWQGKIDGIHIVAQIQMTSLGYKIHYKGGILDICVYTQREAELSRLMPEKLQADMSRFILCPMPGLLSSISVKEGDHVEAGQTVCIIEAMKMENAIIAEQNCLIKSVRKVKGDSLQLDEIIIEIECK